MMSKKQLSVIKSKELSADTIKDFLHADAEPDEVPPADNELPDKSLFDHIVDAKFQGDIAKTHALVHRAVIVSRLEHKDVQEVGQYFEKWFKDTQNYLQCESVSGLLLLFPTMALHMVECSQDMLMELLSQQDQSEHFSKSRILVVSYDVPLRQYQQWSFRALDIEAPSVEDYETTEDGNKVVGEVLFQVLKLGSYLAKLPKATLKNAMDNLLQKVPDLMPQQIILAYLLDGDDPAVIKPAVYLKRQRRPFDVTLQSELVWPMPRRLHLHEDY